ncbi:AsnC family protein [Solihabitans fulvus]|nr:AsnC family protein [Solihabitans fulvus]
MGRAAVHEVAARLGMDPREAAARLVALSGSGLPLLVGVECDPNGVRTALANAAAWGSYTGPQSSPAAGYAPPATGSGYAQPGASSGGYAVQGTPSGAYNAQPPNGGYPAQNLPSGGYPAPANRQGYQQGGYQQQPVQQYPPSAPFPAQQHQGPPSQPFPAQPEPISTWGPPQSASWARGDQPQSQGPQAIFGGETGAPGQRTGKIGTALQTEGLEGERLSIQLVEVVDPADFLFTAAGYRLEPGERSVVVHTEFTNKGQVPFAALPDMYLVLVTKGGNVSKAPVSLSSRPPHRIGVPPGETAGGHTVYVLPEDVQVHSVRWAPRPDDELHSLVWTVEN